MSNLRDADRDISAQAVGLLAHWWSRPLATEVDIWLDMADIAADVSRRLSGGNGTGALPYPPGDVPALLAEYERLFVGPGQVPCPPYESFWRDDVPIDLWHSLMGPCTGDLRRLYRKLGIDMDPASGEPPDHVAVELEALAYALSRADRNDVAKTLMTDHVSQWLPRLCRAVASDARQPFYAGLAAITTRWVTQIHSYVGQAAGASSGAP